MAWIALLGIVLLGAFVTYAVFATVAASRGSAIGTDDIFDCRPQLARQAQTGQGKSAISTRLTEELQRVAESGHSAEEWLRQNRVPYGQCTAEQSCDMTTRCVQCEFFETTAQDTPALQALQAQELKLAEQAEELKMLRKAEIHRGIAESIDKHLRKLERAKEAV